MLVLSRSDLHQSRCRPRLTRPFRLGPMNPRAHPSRDLDIPVVLFTARDLREFCESFGNGRIELLLEQRNQQLSNPVSSELRVRVGSILTPALTDFVQVELQLAAPDSQQRPSDLATNLGVIILNGNSRMNARKPSQSRPANDPHEHGLGLIIQRVGSENFVERRRSRRARTNVMQLLSSVYVRRTADSAVEERPFRAA